MRCILAISLLVAASVSLQATPALSITGNDFYTEGASPGSVRGWSFSVVAVGGIWVTSLGVLDVGADGLNSAHDVGLWNNSGTLLRSATVLAGTASPLDINNTFRLESITALFLAPGTYTIGAYYAAFTDDFLRDSGILTQAFDPSISYIGHRAAVNVASLSLPTSTFVLSNGYFGPGFELSLTPPEAVPEPAAWMLLSGGCGLLTLLRRRTK